MTIAEADRFYDQDKKDYIIENNKVLLSWLKDSITDGYDAFIDMEDLQETIDFISNWYELKYPERELEYYEGIIDTRFEDIDRLSKNMNFRQLMFRLPHNSLCLMECGYRASGWGQNPIYDSSNNTIIGFIPEIFMTVNRKTNGETLDFNFQPYFLLRARHDNGKVLGDHNIEKIVGSDDITLDELLILFDELKKEELDYSELKRSVNNHNLDIELRRKILQLVALKLVYSKNTIPERGYERAKRFISEFNKKIPNLELSTNQIDEIINTDYTDGKKYEWVTKTVIREDGSNYNYSTIEEVKPSEVILEPISSSSRVKRLIRSIFKKR